MITDACTTAHPFLVDHLHGGAARALIARLDRAQGRLDILHNHIGGEPYVQFATPQRAHDLAPDTQLLATRPWGCSSGIQAGWSSRSPTGRAATTTPTPGGRFSSTSRRRRWTVWRMRRAMSSHRTAAPPSR